MGAGARGAAAGDEDEPTGDAYPRGLLTASSQLKGASVLHASLVTARGCCRLSRGGPGTAGAGRGGRTHHQRVVLAAPPAGMSWQPPPQAAAGPGGALLGATKLAADPGGHRGRAGKKRGELAEAEDFLARCRVPRRPPAVRLALVMATPGAGPGLPAGTGAAGRRGCPSARLRRRQAPAPPAARAMRSPGPAQTAAQGSRGRGRPWLRCDTPAPPRRPPHLAVTGSAASNAQL
jgi:hypothetical protein